jgi:hypothetical protein
MTNAMTSMMGSAGDALAIGLMTLLSTLLGLALLVLAALASVGLVRELRSNRPRAGDRLHTAGRA